MTERCLSDDSIVEFMEHRADAALRARVEEHASRCAACREVLSSLARSGPPVAIADEALAPGARVGRYRIAQRIGAGGMGVVYAAHDPELDRMVAVKVLRGGAHPELQLRLRREARAMAQLVHPNVVAVHDVGAVGDRIFIAMEYVPGETLLHWVVGHKTPREILAAYREAGQGLAAAHAAGLVHRDFKPENVLIGKDGRARVGDFGLARSDLSSRPDEALPTASAALDAHDTIDMRATSSAGEPTSGAHGALEANRGAHAPDAPWAVVATAVPAATTAAHLPELTEPGTLLGTPYYMAPELYSGRDADARSDQFAFCVALYTALAGERPLMDATFDAKNASRRAARLHQLASARKLPRRARAAIQRGLATDPADRFATLPELLAQLAPPPRRWPIAIAALALALAGWAALRGADERCTGGPAAFAATWNHGQRAVTTAALLAVGRPYAVAAVPEVEAALDRYALRWADAHRDACRATRVRGDQTEALLALRMACLERRRQEAAALIDTLGRADAKVATRAVDAIAKLEDVAACADVAALQQVVPPPSDPVARAQLAALTPRLARASTADNLGAYAAGLAEARALTPLAHALGYRPFEAEAAFVEGQLAYDTGDLAHAEAALDAAVWAAEVGRHDEIAARAWTLLVFVIGYDKAEYARGLALVPRVTAALARLGGNPDIEAKLERALGAIDAERDQIASAVGHFENAVAIAERAFGPDAAPVAHALDSLGMAVMAQGHPDRAIELQRRALAITERVYGPGHPATARLLNTLGNAEGAASHFAVAEQLDRRALAIREAAIGPVHPDLAANLADLARAVRGQGRTAEALVLDRRSVAMGARAFGPAHPAYAQQLLGLGISLGKAGQLADADRELARAAQILAPLNGADGSDLLAVEVARADLLLAQARWADAARRYAELLPRLERAQGAGDTRNAALASLGQALVELHEPVRALAPLERLAGALDQLPADLRIDVEAHLARALWDSGQDRPRARALASEALTLAQSRPDTPHPTRAALERWVAAHRAP
jgi:serine/threonine protein kinase